MVLQMTLYLIITALTVSIDSFVCGFLLSLNNKKKMPIVIGIALTVFIMCAVTNYGATFLSDRLNEKTASFGGIILICVGLFNLLKKDYPDNIAKKSTLVQTLLTGFAVGLDGAIANLSLSLMGINALYVPITIALMHLLLIYLGIILSKTKLAKRFSKINFIAPLILIVLGAYKVLGLFL